MSLWWVNLGEQFQAQLQAQALWCPNKTIRSDGSLDAPQWHWSSIIGVRPGEFIVLCRDGWIEGLAVARDAAQDDQPKPIGFAGDRWHDQGWLLPVHFVRLAERRSRDELTQGLFSEKVPHSPLFNDPATGRGRGAQIYLTRIRDADALPLFDRISELLDKEKPGWLDRAIGGHDAGEDLQRTVPETTTAIALREARVGQGRFRRDLIRMWQGACCATGLDVEDLLVASHIHPWSLANDEERLDPCNGLLLSCHYDRAFDRGLITIDENGNWQLVAQLTEAQLNQAGLAGIFERPVHGLTDRHQVYLGRHRERVLSQARS